MDDVVLRIRDLIEIKTRSCSMDFCCITLLYVNRMWGGAVAMMKSQQDLRNLERMESWRLVHGGIDRIPMVLQNNVGESEIARFFKKYNYTLDWEPHSQRL